MITRVARLLQMNILLQQSGQRFMASLTVVQQNLDVVRREIKSAANNRNVRLVAVGKYHPKEAIQECYEHGHRSFGENYVQELEEKAEALKGTCPEIQWHFIGQVQSNKIGKIAAVPNLYCVETLESEKHCALFEKAASNREHPLRVLVQVNTSAEYQKGGLSSAEAVSLAQYVCTQCPHLKLDGFMTIGSVENSGKVPNPDFNALAEIRRVFAQKVGAEEDSLELSMGMSGDMITAIDQGSTSVRVGTAIFGARNYDK